jgi:hypothetical protein
MINTKDPFFFLLPKPYLIQTPILNACYFSTPKIRKTTNTPGERKQVEMVDFSSPLPST